MKTSKTERIAKLNDEARQTMYSGETCISDTVKDLEPETYDKVIEAVQTYSDFTPENNPSGERESGFLSVDGIEIYWEFEYYDLEYEKESSDPSDPRITERVLTIVRKEEFFG